MEKKLNFAFFGTPDVASETLEILKKSGFLPSFIITSPDKPQGRKMLIAPPPVKVWAETNNVPFIQPEKLTLEEIKGEFDLFIVVAYGKIIPEQILNFPKMGSINIHYSLLPKYRGASPVESAILNGDTETGVTIQKMVYEMDAGPVISGKKVEILETETAPELRKRLIEIGGELLVTTLPKISTGETKETPQDESKSTYCKKIKKEDGLIDPGGNPVKNYNKFRAYAHWPRTFFFKDGKRIIITQAKLENNRFMIEKIIPEGGKETTYTHP
ncbi:MAG: methionyl-tRNA formyltransferase [Minisyncoccia bacterium]